MVALSSAYAPPDTSADEGFDLVLHGGRVIDPETGLDAVRSVGIRGGTITAVSEARLEAIAPAFARKGRIQVGADADVTIFDPTNILDRATYPEPFRPSAEFPHVIAGGEFVVRDGDWVAGAAPGSWLAESSER